MLAVLLVAFDVPRTCAARHHVLPAAKWAAMPSDPVAGAVPAVSDPTLLVGTRPPARDSVCLTTVTYESARRVSQTRWGGLYGP